MIEAKKLAYADLLHYVGDPRFSKIPVAEMISKELGREAGEADQFRSVPTCSVVPSQLHLDGEDAGSGHDLPVGCGS